jgi:hypothetical protein
VLHTHWRGNGSKPGIYSHVLDLSRGKKLFGKGRIAGLPHISIKIEIRFKIILLNKKKKTTEF